MANNSRCDMTQDMGKCKMPAVYRVTVIGNARASYELELCGGHFSAWVAMALTDYTVPGTGDVLTPFAEAVLVRTC